MKGKGGENTLKSRPSPRKKLRSTLTEEIMAPD